MTKQRLEELCQRGNQADSFIREGRAREALKVLLEIVKDMEKKGDMDSYLSAKVTLGVLRCHVKLADFKSAYQVWNAELEESIYGIGIYALESAQTTVRDMVAYDMICAFLHSLAETESKEAGAAINQYLSRVCEQAIEDGDRSTMRMAVSNWKQHMKNVFGVTIPHQFVKPLIHFEREMGEPVQPAPIDFPAPNGWDKPSDFREMSRISEMRAAAAKAAAPSPSKTPGGKKKKAS